MNPIGSTGGAGNIQQIIAMREQLLDKSQVLQDLRQSGGTQGLGSGAPSVDGVAAKGEVSSFTASLDNALGAVNASQTRSAELSAAYERGEVTDVAKVMLARQEAGVAFEATLQVRNKLLSAYQEIMRMGV